MMDTSEVAVMTPFTGQEEVMLAHTAAEPARTPVQD
jgi:hypothetical protein